MIDLSSNDIQTFCFEDLTIPITVTSWEWQNYTDWEAVAHQFLHVNSTSYKNGNPYLSIDCPWADQHTADTKGTVLFLNDGKAPTFHCPHAHCTGKYFSDVLTHIGGKAAVERFIDKTAVPSASASAPPPTPDASADTTTSTDATDSVITHGIHHFGMGPDNYPTVGSLASGRISTIKPSDINMKFLVNLVPSTDYWLNNFNKAHGKFVTFDTEKCAEYFAKKSINKSYDPELVRGRGLYFDVYNGEQCIVANTGHGCDIGGTTMPYSMAWSKLKNYYHFSGWMNVAKAPAETNIVQAMLTHMQNFNWVNPTHDGKLFLGFVFAAMQSGIIPERPIGILNGPSGTGKTSIVENTVKPLFLSAGGITCTGGTSPAGIEQQLRGTGPVLYDEAEPNSDNRHDHIKNVLELATAGTGIGEGNIYKGTVAGTAIQRKIKSSFLFVAIGNVVNKEAQKRRCHFFQLVPIPMDTTYASWNTKLADLKIVFSEENCGKVMRQIIASHDVFMFNFEYLSNKIKEKYKVANFKIAEYSVIFASLYTALLQRPLTDADLPDIFCTMDYVFKELEGDQYDKNDRSENDLIKKLSLVELDNKAADTHRILQLQQALQNYVDHKDLFQAYGLSVQKDPSTDVLYIYFANGHSLLQRALEKANIHDLKSQLKSQPKAKIGDTRPYYSGKRYRTMGLPVSLFVDEAAQRTIKNDIDPNYEKLDINSVLDGV